MTRESTYTVRAERTDTAERDHHTVAQVERRDWHTSPLWMQIVVIAAAAASVVWLLDEIF